MIPPSYDMHVYAIVYSTLLRPYTITTYASSKGSYNKVRRGGPSLEKQAAYVALWAHSGIVRKLHWGYVRGPSKTFFPTPECILLFFFFLEFFNSYAMITECGSRVLTSLSLTLSLPWHQPQANNG